MDAHDLGAPSFLQPEIPQESALSGSKTLPICYLCGKSVSLKSMRAHVTTHILQYHLGLLGPPVSSIVIHSGVIFMCILNYLGQRYAMWILRV